MSITVSDESGLSPRSVHPHQLFNPRQVGRRNSGNPAIKESVGLETAALLNDPVKCAATTNDSLSGLAARDGVTPVAGDRVAAPFQSTGTQCGIYVAASGAWVRAPDNIYAGGVWEILQGTIYGNRQLVCTNDANPDVGTDAITFAVRPGGTGTANYSARWTATATLGIGIIKDDGSVVQINTSDTTGLFNIVRSSTSAATIYASNNATTGTGTAIYAQTSSADIGAHAAEFWASGGGSGIYVSAAGNGIEVNAAGIGVQSNPLGDAYAFSAARSTSSATSNLVNLAELNSTSTGTVIYAENGGLGRTAHLKRNNASATEPVAEILQDAGTGNQGALKITNDSTGAAYGISVTVTGGIGVAVVGGTVEVGYFYRPSTVTGTAPTVTVWNDSGTDAQDLLYLRQDGTGNILEATKAGTEVVAINNAGTLIAKEGLHLANVRTLTTSPTTLDATDCVVLVDTSAVTHTVTLPTVADGKVVVVKDSTGNAGTRNIAVNRGGATATIDGATSKTIATNYGTLTFVSNGTNWFLI